VPLRRMEDKIQSLCARILAGNDDDEQLSLIVELREALRQHVQRLRTKLSDYPLTGERRTREKTAEQKPKDTNPPTQEGTTVRNPIAKRRRQFRRWQRVRNWGAQSPPRRLASAHIASNARVFDGKPRQTPSSSSVPCGGTLATVQLAASLSPSLHTSCNCFILNIL
jgi:hypothetical protein